MPPLLSSSALEKSFGGHPLFSGIALSVDEGEHIGVLGPNGAGKSTLLKILAGIEDADEGNITRRKGLRLAYLPQEEQFNPNSTVEEILREALASEPALAGRSDAERWARIGEVRNVIGLADLDQKVGTLSGGWRKRVALASKVILRPDVLLLDEPTNHLDLEGITWLEQFIREATCSIVIISHDRTLLENVADRIFEINRVYPEGCFTTSGNYSKFLERRADFLEGIARYEDSLRNKVRREIEWLRRGPKARSTKAKGRIQEAGRLIDELKGYESRSSSQGTSEIDFLSSGRRTKKLIEVQNIAHKLGGNQLFSNLSFTLSPGMRLGVVGANGSGKSTLLKVLDGSLTPDSGTVFLAPQLRVVRFDQNRELLNKEESVRKVLSPTGDTVTYGDRELHVAAWAKRFLFRSEQLQMPVRSLSGGEQARLLIAKLMLQPADVLLLDEPTNDLDIDTLQVLEESLEEFPGAIVLVTHDRFMLDRVSTTVLGLDGTGSAQFFASYAQWEEGRGELPESPPAKKEAPQQVAKPAKPANPLSNEERRKLTSTERKIEKYEAEVKRIKDQLTGNDFTSNTQLLNQLCSELQTKERELAVLVEEWSELASRK